MNNIAYKCGVYDILRAKDLSTIDRMIQMGLNKGEHIFAIGIYTENLCDVLGITEEDEETGEGLRVNLQLNGEILNQAVEIDFKEIYDDLLEMTHISGDKEVIIEIDF